MCFYFKHECPKCYQEHLIFAYPCEDTNGEAACGMQIVLNDGYELGNKSCPNCLKAEYPFDPTKGADPEDTNMEIDQLEGELTMLSQPPKAKANLILPELWPSRFRGLEEAKSVSLLKGAKEITVDIPNKGTLLPPIKSAEEPAQAELELLEHHVNSVKSRPPREWPEPGETREEWKERQKNMRITREDILNDEWEGFTELLRRRQSQSHPKHAIPRLHESELESE